MLAYNVMAIANHRPPAWLNGKEQYFTHSSVGIDDWGLLRINTQTRIGDISNTNIIQSRVLYS
jgi:hypothetical protein